MSDSNDPPLPSESSIPPGVPRWVKIFALVALVLIVLFVIAQVITGGRHGPGRHFSTAHPPITIHLQA